MKVKRPFAILLILTIAGLLYIISNVLPFIFTNLGKSAFEQGNYEKAFRYLKLSNHINEKDKETRYYYVSTLINLKPTLDVQKELFKISETDMPDSADLLADRKIDVWRNQIFSNIGSNYIEQVPSDNRILRWDATKFPLKINIQNSENTNVPKYYVDSIRKAFLQWQATSGNFIKFVFTNNPDDAQIVVKIEPSSEAKNCSGADCKYVVAYTTPKINGDWLEKMEIVFYDTNSLNQLFTQREVYNTALHEIGHSLGIMGHSYNKDDIMYMESNANKTFDQYRSSFQFITPTDRNTLSLLYKLIPDVTNTSSGEYNTQKQFYAPIVIGTKRQITSRKILEAENYIIHAPNLPNGYIDLAAAYTDLKKYNEALQALNKAFSLSKSDNERFIIYYNIAVVYMRLEVWNEALKYAELAKQIQPESEIDGIIASAYFNKGDEAKAKEIYIKTLKKNPSNIIDAVNLARIYTNEHNFIQAGKTINKLIEANPNASSDSRVKAFNFITFLFK